MLPILGLLVGLSAALAVTEQTKRGNLPWQGPYLAGVVLFATFVVAPLGAYLGLMFPAWTWLYFRQPADMSWLHTVAPIAGAPIGASVGYLAGAGLGYKRKPTATSVACGLALIGLAAAFILFGDRMAHLTESLEWPEAPSVFASQLIVVFAFVFPVTLGGWMFLLVLYRLEGVKLRRASGPAALPSEPYQPPQLLPLLSSASLPGGSASVIAGEPSAAAIRAGGDQNGGSDSGSGTPDPAGSRDPGSGEDAGPGADHQGAEASPAVPASGQADAEQAAQVSKTDP